MIEKIRKFAERDDDGQPGANGNASLAPLRAATAQLLLATGAGSTLEQITHSRHGNDGSEREVPWPLTWAPLLLGPLTAAANIEHARRPTARTAMALRFLTAATIGFGGSLFLLDSIAHHDRPSTRLGSLAFASTGLLGLLIDRHEREAIRSEEALRRRARVIDRLIPRRHAKLDRIVVHV